MEITKNTNEFNSSNNLSRNQPVPSTPKVNIYKYLFFISIFILLSIFSILFFFIRTNKLQMLFNQNNNNQPPISVKKTSNEKKPVPEEVPIITASGSEKVDIDTKKIYPNIEQTKFDFSKFKGLPEEYKNAKTSLNNNLLIKSQNQSKMIVRSEVFDETVEASAYDGSQPMISFEDYLCTISDSQCVKNEIISSIKIDDLVHWNKWNSEKNLLYGYLSGEGIGNASPVYIYDINDKTYQKTIGFDTLKENEGEVNAYIPTNFISPSLSKFIMITNYEQPQLLLFNSNDLSKPIKKINLNLPDDGNGSIPYSIAWFKNEKEIVLLNHKQIYVLNLDTEELSLKYTDQTQDDSYLWIDFNDVCLSSNERYVVFVDYIKRDPTQPDDLNQVLKAIDLKENNREIEVLGNNDFLRLDYQF